MSAKPTSMMHKSIDLGWNKSPLNQGRIDVGTGNITVKLEYHPDEKMLKRFIAKQVLSTTGLDPDMELPEALGEELFFGGLQTGLEVPWLGFEISGLSRQLTHELVRTRKGVFHQQSMRHTDMGDQFNVREPQSIFDSEAAKRLEQFPALRAVLGKTHMALATPHEIFEAAMKVAREAYKFQKECDLPYQDARMVCPIATETYIIASYPVSEFLATYAYRACRMFLWEIQYVFKEMKARVIEKFPWMEQFIKVSCEKTKRCMYQGWEDTTKDCEFEWRGDRVYKPNLALIGLKGKAYGVQDKPSSGGSAG